MEPSKDESKPEGAEASGSPEPQDSAPSGGDSLEQELARYFEEGVLWLDGSEPAEKKKVFSEDFQPGLSKHEKEIVELQARMFLKGQSINSILLTSGELGEIKKVVDDEGGDENVFIRKCLSIASVRDDKEDIQTVKDRIAKKMHEN